MTEPFERLKKIREVFEKASELSAEARSEFLRKADLLPKDLEHVKSLLKHYDADSTLLSETDHQQIQQVLEEKWQQNLEGQVFGAYRIIEKVGQGGMGEVYLAERVDDFFEKTAAIKLVGNRRVRSTFNQQFRQEMQILARLQHPYIARLLDGGVTRDGTSYFVMDYVEGEPITAYCDRKKLGISDRLRLAVKLCSAIQFAHQNLVVHRDIKPSNVLVHNHGDPVLLDFGIAKILGQNIGSGSVSSTEPLWFSPNYASPEQIHKQPISTASDIYATGILLHELLCGIRPYELSGSSLAEMQSFISDFEFVKPSHLLKEKATGESGKIKLKGIAANRNLSPGKLRSALRGDLDHILLKAMAKNPADRYQTMQQLTEDLNRFLYHLPLATRPNQLLVCLGKWVKRNQKTSLALAALLLLGCWFAMKNRSQNLQIRRELDRTKHALFLSKNLLKVETDDWNSSKTMTVFEMLKFKAKKNLEGVPDDPEFERQQRLTMGEIYLANGLIEQAAEEIEQAKAICASKCQVESSEHGYCLFLRGALLYFQQEFSAALVLLNQAEALYLQADLPLMAANVQMIQAKCYRARKRLPEAASKLESVLKVRLEKQSPDNPQLPATLLQLGHTYRRMKQLERAEPLVKKALELQLAHHPPVTLLSARIHREMYLCLKARGAQGEEIPHLERAIKITRVLYGNDHKNLGTFLNDLGKWHLESESFAAAEHCFLESLAIRKNTLAKNHPSNAAPSHNLGLLKTRTSCHWEAEAYFQKAIAFNLADGRDRYKVNLGYHRMRYGETLTQLQRWQEAEEQLCEAMDLFLLNGKKPFREMGIAQIYLAKCYIAAGMKDQAHALLEEALPHLQEKDQRDIDQANQLLKNLEKR